MRHYRKNPPVIEIYPMVNESNGDAVLMNSADHAGRQPDFWDVLVRYEGDDPLEEIEDLKSFDEALQAARNLQTTYTNSPIEVINV